MSKVFIHSSAEVSPHAAIGEGTKIWNQVQVREGSRIGKNCVISKDVYIDTGVVIGDGVKVQNGVSIYKGVTLEDEVFVGPHCTFTNDFRPRAFTKDWEVVPTLLRHGCSVGANATVMCGVTLGEYCMIAAGAVITVDTLPYGLYIGNPARLKGFVSRNGFEMTSVEAEADYLVFKCAKTHEKLRVKFEPLD
ncbi:MAG: N-acetyltransferase [Verrucomicrobiae bacterium]|nr:N-acetyltransferase [Verrucomicrobiae bacterium]